MYDIIVIGGGPAGMTAALYALRNGKRVLVLEKHGFGGQITYSPKVENFPGTLQLSGNEIADKMLEQILSQGAEVELEKALSVEDLGSCKRVKTEEGNTFEAKAVVIATGVKHRMLGLQGENELVGQGISFCAVCDGDFFSGQRVCVAGGGNSALQEALLLSQKCREVIILQDLPELTGEQTLQNILRRQDNVKIFTNQKITAVKQTKGQLSAVAVENRLTGERQMIETDGLFIAIGLIPENEPFAPLADLNAYGYFDAQEDCLTRTPGVYVAGDCRSKSVRQLTTACADGAVAALAACRFINEQLA
ncbi:MAG: FAD-dependent oxidoreductase [Clostridia bacterium]|nr:FAD-dependent oxidoreductase [Clostridia bacterium]